METKEIKQISGKLMWDYDQRFKTLLESLKFQILDTQHRGWFITRLLPHIQILMTRQKVTTHSEVLEITMHLESTRVTIESSVGMY